MMQGHLEKLSSNAKSIHHVLEALCGGLDRLEKKMDINSSQVRPTRCCIPGICFVFPRSKDLDETRGIDIIAYAVLYDPCTDCSTSNNVLILRVRVWELTVKTKTRATPWLVGR